MKITNIEVFTIRPPLAKRYRDNPARNGHEHRVAAKVTTDVGIVGYGDFDGEAPPPIEAFDPLIDTDPFDYIGSNLYPAVVMAMYDIMGKYLEVPAYKLIGQKVRDSISSAAWCWGGPTDQELADDVIRAVNDGYTIFKIHTKPAGRHLQLDQDHRGGHSTGVQSPLRLHRTSRPDSWAGSCPSSPASSVITPSSTGSRTPSTPPTSRVGASCGGERS